MKNLLVLVLIVMATLNLVANPDTTTPNIRIAKTYVGLVGITALDTAHNFSSGSSFMVAACAEARFSQDLFLTINLTSTDNLNKMVGGYYLQYGDDKTTWLADVGYMATLISLHRPNPVSPGKQFEPTSKAIIPGGELGGIVWYNYGSGQLGFGLSQAKGFNGADLIDYQASWTQVVGNLKWIVTGRHSQAGQGLALTTQFKGSEITVYTNKDSLASAFVDLNSSTIGLRLGSLFLDGVYNFHQGKYDRLEFGWYDTYKVDYTGLPGSICLGFGWRQYQEPSFRLYVWTYIFNK